jgi:hypothetical protein
MKHEGKIVIAVVVLASLGATAIDLFETPFEPATILTIALIVVTAYYAYRNRLMSAAMEMQAENGRLADIARQREVHVLNVQPFLEPKLGLFGQRVHVSLLPVKMPMLHLAVTLRAMASAREATSVDGRSSQTQSLRSIPPGYEPPTAKIEAANYLDSSGPALAPYEDTWEIEITYSGLLGQWVVETYEWRIREQIATEGRGAPWQLRRLQVVTNVAGAASVDLRFGDV